MELLGHMRNGTFVEIGGNDGLSTTNTYHLERCLGWQGLLIEGHPVNFHKMARARPGALNLGIAVCREHGLANFSERAGVASGINSEMDSFHRKHFHIGSLVRRVPCGPRARDSSACRCGAALRARLVMPDRTGHRTAMPSRAPRRWARAPLSGVPARATYASQSPATHERQS